jgi:hypothetical protein
MWRMGGRAGVGVVALAVAWLVLAVHPQPLFAYSARRSNVVLHARAPLPPQATALLDDVVRRVSRSPLYQPARVHHVFLCDSRALFGLFALWDHNVGGVTQVYLGGNIFVRPASIVRGTVTGPLGNEATGQRTLTYFIAHEITHAMTADRVGRWRYHRLAPFQQEGYADYVAFDHHLHRLDVARARDALERDVPEMNPRRSGLYARHELLVAFLLDQGRLSVDQLLAHPLDATQVEAELRQEPQLPPVP